LSVLYEAELTGSDPRPILVRVSREGGLEPYAAELVEGVWARRATLDRILDHIARGWDAAHMPPIDLIVQRIGLYELLYGGVPRAIAIDEAVTLAKEFSTDDCARFVNGVLDAAAKLRTTGGESWLSSMSADGDEVPPPIPPVAAVERIKELGSELCPPAYGRRSVVEAGRWVLAALGLEAWDEDRFDLPRPPALKRLVVVVIDGLGAKQLRDHRDVASFIWKMPGTFASSTFPSTSATALASICTARFPKEHKIAGYRFLHAGRRFNVIKYEYDPEEEEEKLVSSGILAVRRTPPLPAPERLQPQKTLFERAKEANLGSYVVTRREFEGSKFSDVLLRGASWVPYKRSSEAPGKVREIFKEHRSALVYLYWDGLDKAGHERGPDSPQWLEMLERADRICRRTASVLGPYDGMVVVADHGMIPTKEDDWVELPQEVLRLARAVAGEPRVRYLYAAPGKAEELLAAAREILGQKAWVFSRSEAESYGFFGPADIGGTCEYAGDVIVASRATHVLRDPEMRRHSPKGNHGSLTDDEMFVPFRIATG
jgi:transcription antitermination factor NusB